MDSELWSDYQNSCPMPSCDKNSMVLGGGEDSDNSMASLLGGYLLGSISDSLLIGSGSNYGQRSCPGRHTAAVMIAAAAETYSLRNP